MIKIANDKELKLLLLLSGWVRKKLPNNDVFVYTHKKNKDKFWGWVRLQRSGGYQYFSNYENITQYKTIPELLIKLQEENLI